MAAFRFENGRLTCDQVDVETVARATGTPVLLIAAAPLEDGTRAWADAFGSLDARVIHPVQAAPLGLLRLLGEAGVDFEVRSEAELVRVLRAGVAAGRVVLFDACSGPASAAALAAGVHGIVVDSITGLRVVGAAAAASGRRACVLLGVHGGGAAPGGWIGLSSAEALRVVQQAEAWPGVQVAGFHLGVGADPERVEPWIQALRLAAELVSAARGAGHTIAEIGLRGVGEQPPAGLQPAVRPAIEGLGCRVRIHVGGAVLGPAGLLVSEVLAVKKRDGTHAVQVDAAHPASWRANPGATAAVQPVTAFRPDLPRRPCRLIGGAAGPLVLDAGLPPVARGDLLAAFDAGRAALSCTADPADLAQAVVRGEGYHVVRRRLSPDERIRGEE